MNSEKAISLIAIGLGGIISVSSAGGHYDFVDMVIGIVLLLLVWPMLRLKKAGIRERLVVASIAGLVMVLIAGPFVDHALYLYSEHELVAYVRASDDIPAGDKISIFQNNQTIHSALWLFFSGVLLLWMLVFEKSKD
ncbi:hypothetical protein [Echinimonas agarilytica]|uniref:Uncharacterized protein n=1 Tax=Echinimonas agarilytica TaxID=1215918 RepID=A0AA42B6C8_9GAMM|nr:hypothetical protein [Echinimonas agarilytica]MCM2678504.1 hypothetical protein [Echinimonas agarilytica]